MCSSDLEPSASSPAPLARPSLPRPHRGTSRVRARAHPPLARSGHQCTAAGPCRGGPTLCGPSVPESTIFRVGFGGRNNRGRPIAACRSPFRTVALPHGRPSARSPFRTVALPHGRPSARSHGPHGRLVVSSPKLSRRPTGHGQRAVARTGTGGRAPDPSPRWARRVPPTPRPVVDEEVENGRQEDHSDQHSFPCVHARIQVPTR